MADPCLYLLLGDDEFRVAQAARELVDRLVPEADRSFGLETFDGAVETDDAVVAVLRQTAEAVQTASFLGGAKTVWLRDIAFLAPRRRTGEESDAKAFKAAQDQFRQVLAGGIPKGHRLVLSGSRIARNNGVALEAAKLAKAGRAELQEFSMPTGRRASGEVAARLAEESAKAGRPLPPGLADALVARVGADARALNMELEKLWLYAGDRTPTIEDVAAVVTPSRDAEIWDLQDAFAERDLPRTLSILRRLADSGVSPIAMVIQLVGRVNDLLVLRDALDRGQATVRAGFQWAPDLPAATRDAVEDLGRRWDPAQKHAFVLNKTLAQCRRFRRLELRRARHLLIGAHERMVSIAVPPGLLLELAVIDALSPSR